MTREPTTWQKLAPFLYACAGILMMALQVLATIGGAKGNSFLVLGLVFVTLGNMAETKVLRIEMRGRASSH